MGGKMFLKPKKMTILVGIVAILLGLWSSGVLGLCINGIGHVAGNVEGYYKLHNLSKGNILLKLT